MDLPNPFPDADPQETREWLDALEAVIEQEGPERAHFLLEQLIELGAPRRHQPALQRQHRLHQHHPGRQQQVQLPGRLRRSRRGSAPTCAGTRWPWCCAPTRTTPTSAATSPASPRRRRSTTSASTISGTRRRTSHGGDLVFVQGHSAPGIYARAFMLGPPDRRAAGQLPPGGRRQGPLLLSAPVADAGFLAVPDGVDGPRAAAGDLPGALHEVPARPRPDRRHRRPQGLGLHGRRRDGRARIAGRHRHGRRARSSTT